jgi:hypothetical protein
MKTIHGLSDEDARVCDMDELTIEVRVRRRM